MQLEKYIHNYPDFPKLGITFRDISPLLSSPEAMDYIANEFFRYFKNHDVDLIAGAEARGLIFASTAAMVFHKGLVMVRKKGKLPGNTHAIPYELEYNSAALEMQRHAIQPGQRVLIVDDLLATGGTASAAGKLVEDLGGVVAGYAFVIELAELQGRSVIGDYDIQSLVTY